MRYRAVHLFPLSLPISPHNPPTAKHNPTSYIYTRMETHVKSCEIDNNQICSCSTPNNGTVCVCVINEPPPTIFPRPPKVPKWSYSTAHLAFAFMTLQCIVLGNSICVDIRIRMDSCCVHIAKNSLCHRESVYCR